MNKKIFYIINLIIIFYSCKEIEIEIPKNFINNQNSEINDCHPSNYLIYVSFKKRKEIAQISKQFANIFCGEEIIIFKKFLKSGDLLIDQEKIHKILDFLNLILRPTHEHHDSYYPCGEFQALIEKLYNYICEARNLTRCDPKIYSMFKYTGHLTSIEESLGNFLIDKIGDQKNPILEFFKNMIKDLKEAFFELRKYPSNIEKAEEIIQKYDHLNNEDYIKEIRNFIVRCLIDILKKNHGTYDLIVEEIKLSICDFSGGLVQQEFNLRATYKKMLKDIDFIIKNNELIKGITIREIKKSFKK